MNQLKAAVTAAKGEYLARNSRSRDIASDAAQSLPGGNTRSSLWYEPFPLCMVYGNGSRLRDADGHEYIDFLGEFTAGICGHSPQIVTDAIARTLADGINLSAHNRWEGQLALLIRERFPSMELLRFTNSGTEANLMALAAACVATGRRKILVFEGAYHGGVLSFANGSSPVNVPHSFVMGRYNDEDGARAIFEAHGNELAAVLVEPMLGAGGCVPGSPQFLQLLRELTRQSGALLIFDEIQTARLSYGGRQSLLGIKPDLTTVGKFFGGGLPFGCFGGKNEVMKLFDPSQPGALPHAGTFNNNTLTMAAGCAALDGLLTAQALDNLNSRGERFREAMLASFQRTDAPFTVTGLGSIMNIHPAGSPESIADLRKLLHLDLLAAGIYIASRGLIALSLSITEADTSRFVAALDDFLQRRQSLFCP